MCMSCLVEYLLEIGVIAIVSVAVDVAYADVGAPLMTMCSI